MSGDWQMTTGDDRRERAETPSPRLAGAAIAAGVTLAAHSDTASARWPFRSREKAPASASEVEPTGPATTYPAKAHAPVRVKPLDEGRAGFPGFPKARRAEVLQENPARTPTTVSEAWNAATTPGSTIGLRPAAEQAQTAGTIQAVADALGHPARTHRNDVRAGDVHVSESAAFATRVKRKPRKPASKLGDAHSKHVADANAAAVVTKEAPVAAADRIDPSSAVTSAVTRDVPPSPPVKTQALPVGEVAPRAATTSPTLERSTAGASGAGSVGKTSETAVLAATPGKAVMPVGVAPDGISWFVVAPVAGLLATSLLVPAFVKRKRRKAQMNTPTRTPTTDVLPRASKVRMFSSREIWPPNHASHHGPWEAPAETESFAHLYRVGTNAALDLLFVDAPTVVNADANVGVETLRDADHRAAVFNGMHLPAPALDDADVSRAASSAMKSNETASTRSPAAQDDAAKAAALSVLAAMGRAGTPEARDVEQAAQLGASERVGVSTIDVTQMAGEDRAPTVAPPAISNVQPTDSAHTTAIAHTPASDRSRDPQGVAVLDPSSFFVGANGASREARVEPGNDAPGLSKHDVAPAREMEHQPAVEATAVNASEPAENATAQMQAGPAAEPVSQPVVDAPAAPRRMSLERIRKMVDDGALREALEALAVWQSEADAPSEVWMLSAWAWWRVANASGRPEAYREAAEAMEHLLVRDSSQHDVWYRAGSCRLLQAEGEQGDARARTLDTAVASLRRALEGGATPEVNVAVGDALYQRALGLHDSRARSQALTEATEALRAAMRHSRDVASPAAWKLQEVLQARARMLTGEAASRLRLEADALLEASVLAAPADQRGAWYAAKVENELAHAELAEGATRMLHLRRFRAAYQDALTGPDATPDLLLSWLELIALETAHLRGAAATARFDEGAAILDRVDAMLPKNPHVALARARLLRRRARHAGDGSRLSAMNDAFQTLAPFLSMSELHGLRLEAVDLLLERAALLPPAHAESDWQTAEAMATPLIDDPAVGAYALRAVLDAKLARSTEPAPLELVQRLAEIGAHDARARWTLAQATMRVRQPETASEHCAAAVRAGLQPDSALKILWARANREWAELSSDPAHDRAWQANRQALRAIG